jgi:hypothetical protein
VRWSSHLRAVGTKSSLEADIRFTGFTVCSTDLALQSESFSGELHIQMLADITLSAPVATVLAAMVTTIGALLGYLATFFLNKGKWKAELEKIQLECDKLRAETRTLSATIQELGNPEVIYKSVGREVGADFNVSATDVLKGKGPKAEGKFQPDGELLNVHRSNTDGRFTLELLKYTYQGSTHSELPANESLDGKRSIKVECEAKALGGTHTLRFVLKHLPSDQWLHDASVIVPDGNKWTKLHAFLQADPSKPCQFRIDDILVSKPGSLQMKNLILSEVGIDSLFPGYRPNLNCCPRESSFEIHFPDP